MNSLRSIDKCTEDRKKYYCKIILAEQKIEVESFNKRVLTFLKDYSATFDEPDFIIEAADEENQVRAKEHLLQTKICSPEENIAVEFIGEERAKIYRRIADKMLWNDVILMHGAAIAIGDKCFVFIAPSGTGKTTHIMNWLKVIPGTMVINGDKPLINVNRRMVFGTPWCGKENLNTNTSSPLAGIIALERSEKNSISSVPVNEMLPVLLRQCYVPAEKELALKAIQLISKLKDVPFYKLRCNMNEESAIIAYRGLMST